MITRQGCAMHDRRKAFTVVEMLIVMALLAAVAALLLPVVASARSRARNVECLYNLKSLGTAYLTCVEANGGKLPDVYYRFAGSTPSWTVSLLSKPSEPDRFFRYATGCSLRCPRDTKPTMVLAYDAKQQPVTKLSSYAYNLALPLGVYNISRTISPVNTAIFFDGDVTQPLGTWALSNDWSAGSDTTRHRGSASYVYLDGHVEGYRDFPMVAYVPEHPVTPPAPVPTGLISGIIPIYEKKAFSIVTPTGTITVANLKSTSYSYTGPAVSVLATPKDSSGWVKIDSNTYKLQHNSTYTITAKNMHVNLSFKSGKNWTITIIDGSNGKVQ